LLLLIFILLRNFLLLLPSRFLKIFQALIWVGKKPTHLVTSLPV